MAPLTVVWLVQRGLKRGEIFFVQFAIEQNGITEP